MPLLSRKGLLDVASIFVQTKRFRGKINLRKPPIPNHLRATFQAVTKPIVVFPKLIPQQCERDSKVRKQDSVENPLQRIYANELLEQFKTSSLVAFLHLNPMTGEQNYMAYVLFYRQNMLYKNYGKKTLEMAVKGTPYETVLDLYMSHNMIVFSPEPNIKGLLKVTKKVPQIVLLAGIFEGRFMSKDELVKYSTIPNLEAARSEFVQTLETSGGDIVNKLGAHQQNLVSQLDERAKQLEVK